MLSCFSKLPCLGGQTGNHRLIWPEQELPWPVPQAHNRQGFAGGAAICNPGAGWSPV